MLAKVQDHVKQKWAALFVRGFVSPALAQLGMLYLATLILLFLDLRLKGEPEHLYTPSTPLHSALSFVIPLALYFLLPQRQQRPSTKAILAFLLLGLASIAPFTFSMRSFGMRDLPVLLVYLSHLDMSEVVGLGYQYHLRNIIEHFLAISLLLWVGHHLLQQLRGTRPLLIGMSGFLLSQSPLLTQNALLVDAIDLPQLINPSQDVIEPKILKEPSEQKNLIIIYFESMEEAFTEIPSTAPYFKELVTLANQNLRLHGIAQLPGMDYSAAGFVATQCGVPLLPKEGSARMIIERSEFAQKHGVMPSITCLGDILATRGYQSLFVNGADLNSWGIKNFLKTHGFQRVIDRETFLSEGYEGPLSWWGVPDDVFYSRVGQELEAFAKSQKPFLLAIENTGTHSPDGVLDDTCEPSLDGNPRMVTAIACGVRHVHNLLKKVEDLGLSKNTLILITSDHLMMRNTLDHEIKARKKERYNFTYILNAPHKAQIARLGSMMDVYPTLLETLGFEIEQGAAGLGRSYLNAEKNLVEQHGVEALSRALRLNFPLSQHLWRLKDDSLLAK